MTWTIDYAHAPLITKVVLNVTEMLKAKGKIKEDDGPPVPLGIYNNDKSDVK